MACKSCGSKSLVPDDVTGVTVCSDCGAVQDFDNYQHHFGGISGPQGTFVRLGTAGSGTDYSYKERKLLESNRIINDITFRLNLTDVRVREVKEMAGTVTEGEFGVGEWFHVLVGACCYIVMRKLNKALSLVEVSTAVGCDLYELGKMVNRVVEHLGLDLPEFDVVGLLEKTMRGFSGFSGLDGDKIDLMIKQGIFLIQCAIKWFLTTGRRPGPVVVALLVFVAELNDVKVAIEEVAKEVNVAVSTCKTRYREFLGTLVEAARWLPWGKDINVKNIIRHAPIVIKYMEIKLSLKKRPKSVDDEECNGHGVFELGDMVADCSSREVGYGKDGGVNENDSEHFDERHNQNRRLSLNEVENHRVSHVDLARIYSKFKLNVSKFKMAEGTKATAHTSSRRTGYELHLYDNWWSGRSELCRKLMLQELLEKDVGLEALPPSYVNGIAAVKRRREKIEAAKVRISEIFCSSNVVSTDIVTCLPDQDFKKNDDLCLPEGPRKRRKRQKVDIDSEDFIIETLLLHQVKEEEIEKGHYNTLLDLHVFNSGAL